MNGEVCRFQKKIIRKIIHTITCIYQKKKKNTKRWFSFIWYLFILISLGHLHTTGIVYLKIQGWRLSLLTSIGFWQSQQDPIRKKGNWFAFCACKCNRNPDHTGHTLKWRCKCNLVYIRIRNMFMPDHTAQNTFKMQDEYFYWHNI